MRREPLRRLLPGPKLPCAADVTDEDFVVRDDVVDSVLVLVDELGPDAAIGNQGRNKRPSSDPIQSAFYRGPDVFGAGRIVHRYVGQNVVQFRAGGLERRTCITDSDREFPLRTVAGLSQPDASGPLSAAISSSESTTGIERSASIASRTSAACSWSASGQVSARFMISLSLFDMSSILSKVMHEHRTRRYQVS